MINNQYIGQLNGLKLELDYKIGALDTDIKSLKKAARQNVAPEILRRIEQIIKNNNLQLNNDFKIYWNGYSIAQLVPGKDYLNPDIKLIIDDMIENEDQTNLTKYLTNWIHNKIKDELKNLLDLKNIENSNSLVRALAFRIYEGNGVVKRNEVENFLGQLEQKDRKILRALGVRFGRYHIFLHKLLKPKSVLMRVMLWKNYYQKYLKLETPKFGLNFISDKKNLNQDFMLICGFEKLDNFYIRIDILERLFLMIFEIGKIEKKEIKLKPEMLNLLGCSKENFVKLIEKMDYKTYNKSNEIFFKYFPKKKFKKINERNKIVRDNPFNVLKEMSIK